MMDRFFNVLMWMIVGAIIVTVLVTGGGNSVKLASIFTQGYLRALSLITGQQTDLKLQ